MAIPFLFFLAPPLAFAAYSGPFTLVSQNGLAGSADLATLEGPSDHIFFCATLSSLVYLEIDNGTASRRISTDGGATWAPAGVDPGPPCADGSTLSSKDAGYSLSVTRDPQGLERVLVVGGDDDETNSFASK